MQRPVGGYTPGYGGGAGAVPTAGRKGPAAPPLTREDIDEVWRQSVLRECRRQSQSESESRVGSRCIPSVSGDLTGPEQDQPQLVAAPREGLHKALHPESFNAVQAARRRALVEQMLDTTARLHETDYDAAARSKVEMIDSHEAALQRHKESLRRQLDRGQILEGVQKLTVNYDVAANKNVEDHRLLADSLLSNLPPASSGARPPRK